MTLAALLLVPPAVMAQDVPMGQIVLDNQSSQGADLIVDGAYLCTAPEHSSCTGDVPSGMHTARVVFGDGDTIDSGVIDVPGDMSMTLPVRDLMS
ncbi:MAG: hypothetical protein WDN44_02665 [Sphingomonas sp.]